MRIYLIMLCVLFTGLLYCMEDKSPNPLFFRRNFFVSPILTSNDTCLPKIIKMQELSDTSSDDKSKENKKDTSDNFDKSIDAFYFRFKCCFFACIIGLPVLLVPTKYIKYTL